MPSPFVLLRCIAKAVVRKAVNWASFGVSDIVFEIYDDWQKAVREEERPADVQTGAQLRAAELPAQVACIVREEAATLTPKEQEQLTSYLIQVPAMIRRSLRRPSDPSGMTTALGATYRNAEDLLPLLPSALPRFKAGDRPAGIGDWELVELLGVGGFGEVWKARNPHFDGVAPVALKFCLDAVARDHLLKHEAGVLNQVMRQGKHEGIVPLLHSYLSADPPCLAYQYIDGGDLAGRIREWRDGLPAEEATRAIRHLAEIVGFAHRLNPPIVHRDLKPANVLVESWTHEKPVLWITDFGIGGLAIQDAVEQTRRGTRSDVFQTEAVRGAYTPLYASPQQMRGDAPDPPDDVYSLGVIWYQLLTGDLTQGRPGGDAWKRRLANRGMTQKLIALLAECFEDNREDRPENAEALAEKLIDPPPPLPPLPPPLPPPPPPPPPPTSTDSQRSSFTNSIGMEFKLVKPGVFHMGSPTNEAERAGDQEQHKVEITHCFYAGIYPVTQEQYQRVMDRNPSHFSSTGGGKEKVKGMDTQSFPVESVSWEDAREFCCLLSEMPAEKKLGRTYRLPTEAEWEYVCRGGHLASHSATAFHFGNSLSSTQANFDGNDPYGGAAKGPCLQRTTKVGCYPDNPLGLYDLHGNVLEWCADRFDEEYYKTDLLLNPKGPDSGERCTLRGGSWNHSGRNCRTACRMRDVPGKRDYRYGFRVVRIFSRPEAKGGAGAVVDQLDIIPRTDPELVGLAQKNAPERLIGTRYEYDVNCGCPKLKQLARSEIIGGEDKNTKVKDWRYFLFNK